jgi:tetratricopeptide (TPR) repeat protein
MLALGALLIASSAVASEKIPITTASEEARSFFLQGRDLAERLQGQESLKFFEKAIAADPDFAMAHLLAAGPQPTATQFFDMLNKAVARADKVSDAERWWILGFEAGVNGNPTKQREYYKKLVDAYPQDERARNLLGTHYFGQQEFALAIEEYERATSIAPDYTPPYNLLGYSHRALKQYGPAEKAFKRYIELIPDDPNPYDSYAELLLKMGKFDASIENYEKALKHNPNFVASYLGIATNLYLQGSYNEARATLEKQYDIARNDGERRAALFGTLVTYVDEGNMSRALSAVDKRMELAKKNDDVASLSGDFNLKANLLYESGRYDEALAAWEESVKLIQESELSDEIKQNNKRAVIFNAGRVALKKDDLAGAKEKARTFQAQATEAQNTFQIWLSHDLMGMIALEEGKHDKALEHLRQANQQNPYVLYRMAMAHNGQGNSEKANELCMEAAHWNQPTNLNFAYTRSKAQQMLTTARR